VGTENLQVLRSQDLIRPYESADVSGISDEFIDPDGYMFTESLSALVLGVNMKRWEEQFGDRPLPETWDELLNEDYAGEIVMPNPVTSGTAYAFVATQIFRLGEGSAWDYLDQLDPLVGEYTTSGGAPSQLAASGEYMMAISYTHDLVTAKQAGFPIEIVHPQETGYMVAGISIVENGPNPDAAEQFIDWLLGRDAQQKYQDLVGGMSARGDVIQPEGTIPLAELSLVDFDIISAAERRDDVLDEFIERYDP
jgi:iron(III) transport system substrate-binding protein